MQFVIGMMVGAAIGVVVMCLVTISPSDEEWEEKIKKGENKDDQ